MYSLPYGATNMTFTQITFMLLLNNFELRNAFLEIFCTHASGYIKVFAERLNSNIMKVKQNACMHSMT